MSTGDERWTEVTPSPFPHEQEGLDQIRALLPDVQPFRGRMAVQVHGCFWHQCPIHCHAPKGNAEWWRLNFASIRSRDADTERMLHEAGWLPVVVWEHEDMAVAARRVQALDRERRTIDTSLHPLGQPR